MIREISTDCGKVRGNERENCLEFLGIRYAKAERFEYAYPMDSWDGVYDATSFGPCCVQRRTFVNDLHIKERLFYYREFREGLDFTYDEDCLNLNIYTPKEPDSCPVLIFIHGGGFNSMANSEGYLDGSEYASRGVILVTINYRVGIFGYLTHEEIQKSFGHDGNFGLSDQITAIAWVKKHIASFGGAPENITIMGQSAGAISVQDICLASQAEGLFQRAIMISGGGSWPFFAAPKKCSKTRDYWKSVRETAGAASFEEFKKMPSQNLILAVEKTKEIRKDGIFCTMPVIDGFYLKDKVSRLIKHPVKIPYMIGVTNNDMYTLILYLMAKKFARKPNGYMYFFDADAPGDSNQAFHSSDLRYFFGTLDKSHRPYSDSDKNLSNMMLDYVVAFAKNGNPNSDGLPNWKPGKSAMCFSRECSGMAKPDIVKLIKNTFKGDPV